MFNLKDWRIEDPYPGTPLDEIDPHSSRAWAALSRSKDNDIVQQGFLNLVGAIDMMRGLEYHHTNFRNIVGEIALLPLRVNIPISGDFSNKTRKKPSDSCNSREILVL